MVFVVFTVVYGISYLQFCCRVLLVMLYHAQVQRLFEDWMAAIAVVLMAEGMGENVVKCVLRIE
jgi:hypothetical protein